MLSASDIKYYASLKQKKFREESGKFLIEGFHLVGECLSSSYHLDLLIIRDDVELNDERFSKKIIEKKIRIESLQAKSFNKLSETENSQGIIGIVSKITNPDTTPPSKVIIALDRITDPGNLGTILRTAYWFGVELILISENSVDIYNSKVIRASQGAIFHVNMREGIDLLPKLNEIKDHGYKIYLLTPKGNDTIKGINKGNKAVFVFGNESEGISEELFNSGFHLLKIEGYSECESLNVAVSAGIVLNDYIS